VAESAQMEYMFNGADVFNQDICSWDVSSATDMRYMFCGVTSFNQNSSGWCVSNITSAPTNFDASATSWVLARPVWGTCPL
jgi:surface protein